MASSSRWAVFFRGADLGNDGQLAVAIIGFFDQKSQYVLRLLL